MQAPLNQIDRLRQYISDEYLPIMRQAAGFVSASMLEQVDDRDNVKLVVYWQDQRSVENANSTGLLLGSDSSLVAQIPGTRIQRQSYIMQASTKTV